MIKISNKEILDIVTYNDEKVIFVEKKPTSQFGQYKVNYFILNLTNGDKEVITKNAYLLKKFGASFQGIVDTIANFVQCDSVIFPSKNIFVIFPNGQTGYFNAFGEMKWNGALNYNEHPCSSATSDGDYFWTCCKDENCVIRYSADKINLDLRIGGKDANTFQSPIFVSSNDEYVFISCENGTVRKIDKQTYAVSDVASNIPNLKKFYKYGKFSIICTTDGAYIEKD